MVVWVVDSSVQVLVKLSTNHVSDDCGMGDSVIWVLFDDQPKNDRITNHNHHIIITRIKNVPLFIVMI